MDHRGQDYWLSNYDWCAQKKYINSYANYTMNIEAVDVHSIALLSDRSDAAPMVMLHG